MIEFIKNYYVEIAAAIVAFYILIKLKRVARKIVALVFSLAAISRVILMFAQ